MQDAGTLEVARGPYEGLQRPASSEARQDDSVRSRSLDRPDKEAMTDEDRDALAKSQDKPVRRWSGSFGDMIHFVPISLSSFVYAGWRGTEGSNHGHSSVGRTRFFMRIQVRVIHRKPLCGGCIVRVAHRRPE